ncbi:MAG: DUF3604 domain-containing protein [Halioglobus sp.]
MIKKILLAMVILLALLMFWFYAIGKGWFGGPWESAGVTPGPRYEQPSTAPTQGISEDAQSTILFGDLHNHTNYSMDAYLFSTNLVKNSGRVTPADACDFARYCSALDFWSINDHAEGLTPRVWADTVESIRNCNAQAGDPSNPDMVSFVGWEWSNTARDDIPSHYGHKNVIFRTWEEGQVPTRAISSEPVYLFARLPSLLVGLFSLVDKVNVVSDFGWYINESRGTVACEDDVPVSDLANDCREVALTPATLYRKLDEWGFDSLVIPHGLAWGTTNPPTADFRNQLDQHQPRYQKLLEVYSGHGNSEVFEDFVRIGFDESGNRFCPEPTENFTPCCAQAQVIARSNCAEPGSTACDETVATTLAAFLEKGSPAGRTVLPEATMNEWAGCGQLRNNFQPSSLYAPRQSAQYNFALGFDNDGKSQRVKFGLIGSSDGHQAKPGSSYKETDRILYTDTKEIGRESVISDFYKTDKESGAFYYTGGLVAAHTQGRDRDAIWQALDNRNVYATSGDRMLVWFDLLNGPAGEVPMGSEVVQTETPRFRVKALGAFEQLPGCPDFSVAALGQERALSLCGGECFRPGDRRKAISRIEVIRIRPQISPGEAIAPLIEDRWRVFDCADQVDGCVVEFDDPEYMAQGRSTLYYARVIQEKESLIAGDPFGCERNDVGECVSYTYCVGKTASPDNNCQGEAEPRAWTSPIFLEPTLN